MHFRCELIYCYCFLYFDLDFYFEPLKFLLLYLFYTSSTMISLFHNFNRFYCSILTFRFFFCQRIVLIPFLSPCFINLIFSILPLLLFLVLFFFFFSLWHNFRLFFTNQCKLLTTNISIC